MHSESTSPLCSVIVPVFNHWHLVPGLVDRLTRQVPGTPAFELLLVDNGSDDLPEDPRLPGFTRLLHCAVPGSYAARNAGIRESRGQLLAFTDADCLPERDWLERAVACARERRGADIIAGAITVISDNAVPNPYELYDLTLGLPQQRYVRQGYGTTANLLVPRAVFDQAGEFDSGRFSGGDAEFCRRAGRHGIETRYCGDAMVYHPARASWEALAGKVRRIKGGQIASGPFGRRLHYAVRTLLPPLRYWRLILVSARLQSPRLRWSVFRLQCRLWGVEITELLRLLYGRPASRQ